MLRTFNSEDAAIDLGHGLTLSFGDDGHWQVAGANGTCSLRSEKDFYRAVTMLEKSFVDANEAVRRYSMARPDSRPFQFDAVVKMALQSTTDHWAARALEWFPHLPLDQRRALADALRVVITAKWAGQKLRQQADRELKRLVS
ncbi:hypothetical protein [Pandoraea pnomenusa]|uniref:hypothetical protein n=1 Tax=Pandoraea pnomenusa TaxID=93220 RepID=UPI001146D04A|nr:hypothetical protein [Pandoraea pnomenusa]QDH60143.1 hypothetical protein FKQ53_13175 [Pandoraea pnomenusa]